MNILHRYYIYTYLVQSKTVRAHQSIVTVVLICTAMSSNEIVFI